MLNYEAPDGWFWGGVQNFEGHSKKTLYSDIFEVIEHQEVSESANICRYEIEQCFQGNQDIMVTVRKVFFVMEGKPIEQKEIKSNMFETEEEATEMMFEYAKDIPLTVT